MKGRVGVGYRLFNELFLGQALHPKNVINDYAMIRERVSEFSYIPIIDNVEGLAMRKHDFKHLFMKSFWRQNFAKQWCRNYVSLIKKVVNDHRNRIAEKFKNRVDYCDLSAFGVNFK